MNELSHDFFQELQVPNSCRLVGLSALVQKLGVKAPVRTPSCVADHHIKGSVRMAAGWRIFDKRYLPDDSLPAHLSFALKHEPFDLLALKRILEVFPAEALAEFIKQSPSGASNRRAWFLYEFLTGRVLDIDVTLPTNIVDLLDQKKYFVVTKGAETSRRHRVRNNMLGNADFCPLIRRTPLLEGFIAQDYSEQSKKLLARISNDLIARAANFLLLADTKATFAIEGERPNLTRLQRWAKAVKQAGKYELSIPECERLQNILIEDSRFIRTGVRKKMVFVSKGDSVEDALPEYIPAKVEDLQSLLLGLVAANQKMAESEIDPVLQAAATAFGLVYVHPYEDGNGRIHRCVIHNVLSRRGYTPAEMFFPVSSVMAREIAKYEATLQAHSLPLMPYIDWEPLHQGIRVLNDTADLYRYFDCTKECEFLYLCVACAVEREIPLEIDYLQRHDRAMEEVMNVIDLPDSLAKSLIMFMRQNNWKLPKTRREAEFEKLTDDEVSKIEAIVQNIFDGFPAEGFQSRLQ